MSEENILTKEIAQQFLEDENSVDLAEFTSIEDAAAEIEAKERQFYEEVQQRALQGQRVHAILNARPRNKSTDSRERYTQSLSRAR